MLRQCLIASLIKPINACTVILRITIGEKKLHFYLNNLRQNDIIMMDKLYFSVSRTEVSGIKFL